MSQTQMFAETIFYVQWLFFLLISAAGFVGAAFVMSTRDDAFDAADRQSKLVWVALLIGSSLAVAFRFPLLSWAGMVIIGLYWFDVRPQIKDILSGNYRW